MAVGMAEVIVQDPEFIPSNTKKKKKKRKRKKTWCKLLKLMEIIAFLKKLLPLVTQLLSSPGKDHLHYLKPFPTVPSSFPLNT
jgi:hypothetical protein